MSNLGHFIGVCLGLVLLVNFSSKEAAGTYFLIIYAWGELRNI